MPAKARDEAIRTVSVWVLDRVTHRGQRLRALQALVRQWPNDRLRALDLEVIVRWQAMVQEHAAALRHETELLRVQLAPMFGVAPGLDRKSRDEAALTIAGAAQALPYLAALIGDQDTVLSAAFTPCTAAPCRDPGIEQLIQGFVDIESRAARFSAPWSLDR